MTPRAAERAYAAGMGPAPRVADWLLPALIGAVGLAELASMEGLDGRGAAGVLLVLSCALLVLRRRWPLVASTLALLLQVGLPFVGPAYDEAATGLLVVAVGIFALARWIPDLRGLLGLAVVLVALLGGYTFADARDKGLDDIVFVAAITLPPYVMGRIVRRLADYNAVLAREQELVRQAAVRDERDRIARELHDVIAHSLSAMVVQVAAAQELLASDPGRARAVLDRVATTGRTAIGETGRLLHVIRDSDDELGLAPTPGLADLAALVAGLEHGGLSVDLVTGPVPDDLPPAVDLSAYRILREALTNAARYASDQRVRVEVAATPTALVLRASNATEGRVGGRVGAGLGLLGMAERVELLGGTLSHGTTDGRFELVATLPLVREPV